MASWWGCCRGLQRGRRLVLGGTTCGVWGRLVQVLPTFPPWLRSCLATHTQLFPPKCAAGPQMAGRGPGSQQGLNPQKKNLPFENLSTWQRQALLGPHLGFSATAGWTHTELPTKAGLWPQPPAAQHPPCLAARSPALPLPELGAPGPGQPQGRTTAEPTVPTMLSTAVTRGQQLLTFKLIEIQNSASYSHQPHFKCSEPHGASGSSTGEQS